MKKGFFFILLALGSSSLLAQSPGGVSSNLRWWLKANSGLFTDSGTTPLTTDGQLVGQWNDQSTVLNHSRQTTNGNRPVWKTNIINGNPALRFSTDQFLDALSVAGVASNENFMMFLVFKQNSFAPGGTADGSGTFIVDRTTATNNLMSFKIVNTDKYFYQKRNDDGSSLGGPVSVTSATVGNFNILSYYRVINTAFGIILNSRVDATAAGDNGAITAPQLRIGRHATSTNGGLDGDLSEVILYNTALTASDRLKVESYLGIKYGITLDQTVATNYINPSGFVVFPATTTHDNYDQNIAGIARENSSGLLQSASQSQNPNSIVRIFNPSSLDNGDYMMWGNDSPVIWNSLDVPSPYTNRLSRIWRVAQTANNVRTDAVGTVSISFDLTGLGVDMSDPTKFALLIDDNGVFSDATVHTTGRSIAGNVVSFTGATIGDNKYFAIASPAIPGPGGVAATTIWVRADEEVYVNAGTTLATNGQTVRQWNTKNGTAAATANQATGGNRPTYVTNSANGNPVVRFGTNKLMDFGALGVASTADLSMTMVFKPSSTSLGTVTDAAGMYMLDRTAATTPQFSLKMTTGNTFSLQERTDAGAVNGVSTTSTINTSAMQILDFYRDYAVRFGIFYNGAQENTLTESGGALTLPIPRLGATQAGAGFFDGDIAEYIFFNRKITTAERNRIDSYLAIKYGITLNQSTLTNYTSSDGTVIYPATSTHSGYVSDIAGIGRDAVSRLVQTNSKSANANSVVRVSNPSDLQDLEFFVWGDNGGSVVNNTATGVDGVVIKRRLSRIWRASEPNFNHVGSVTISFDLTNVPGNKNQADLRLMIDHDLDGFADNDVTPLTGTLAGNIFTVTGVDIFNRDFFTIGTVNATSTPLPISLVDFTVALEKSGVVANWKTQSEINNDYFTLERSYDGVKFVEALRVKGAGTTTETKLYQATDNPRAFGTIYYRLKQTDFDGKTSYSEVRKVKLPEVPFFVNLYPNPTATGEFTTEVPFDVTEVSIEVLNSAGQTIYKGASNDPVTTWTVSQMTSGIYFVRIATDLGSTAQKIVVK